MAFTTALAFSVAERDCCAYMFFVAVSGISTPKGLFVKCVMHLKHPVLLNLFGYGCWIFSKFNPNSSERDRCIQSLFNNNSVILVHMFLVGLYLIRHGSSFYCE